MSHHIARWLLALLALGLAGCSAERARVDLGWRRQYRTHCVRRQGTAQLADPRSHVLEQRYSPLAQITTDNAPQLGLAWTKGADGARSFRHPHRARWCDGRYVVVESRVCPRCGDDAAKWLYDPKVDRANGSKACCDVVNRGVAIYGGKVFVGALDGRCARRETGTVVWETLTVDQSLPYCRRGPACRQRAGVHRQRRAEYAFEAMFRPTTLRPAGCAGGFIRSPAIQALGAMAPHPASCPTAETWTGEWWKLGGGGTVWDAIVHDQEFDQLIIGVGNGSPWNQKVRSPKVATTCSCHRSLRWMRSPALTSGTTDDAR